MLGWVKTAWCGPSCPSTLQPRHQRTLKPMVAAAVPLMVGLGCGQRGGDCCTGAVRNALLGFLPPARRECKGRKHWTGE